VSAGPLHQAGFSLLESLVAIAITAAVTAAVFAVVSPSRALADVQPEFVDMQQRLRVGVETLRRDLLMAGAGAYSGSSQGSLLGHLAPVLPFRRGVSAAYDDGPGVFKPDAITILYVPSTASQTTLRAPMADPSIVGLNLESGCPPDEPPCGFKAGAAAAVFDGTGAFDAFDVSGVDPTGTLALQPMLRGGIAAYPSGSKIVEVIRRSYFLDAARMQLMRYDGLSAASTVLDNVVGLEFEYFGEPDPPAFRRPGVDRLATYGPSPPAMDVTAHSWPPGENCTWQVVGDAQVPRLPSLGAPGSSLVKLTAAQLTDGPWCPEGSAVGRYDADLLRVRKIHVTIRLQTGDARLRASARAGRSALFANPGSAASASRIVPDQSIAFDVSPRNMNLGR